MPIIEHRRPAQGFVKWLKEEKVKLDLYRSLFLEFAVMRKFLDVHLLVKREPKMRQQLSNFKANFFKALAHPLRISILDALREGELTVNEISQKFSVEPPNASQQLAVLRHQNIIMARKEGASVYYSVNDPTVFKLLDVAREIFNHQLIGVRGMLEAMNMERPSKTLRY